MTDLTERIARAIIIGSAGERAADHAQEFDTGNWADAKRSAREVLPIITAENAAQAAEIERLRKMLLPQWFYADGYSSEDCFDSPDEVIERLGMEPGRHVLQIDCAGPMPSIWCAVHVRTDEEMDALGTDDRVILTEHSSKEDAARALTGGQP